MLQRRVSGGRGNPMVKWAMPTLPLLWAATTLLVAPATANNVLLITVDTLRGDVLAYAGGPAHTPFFDALAKDSWRFDACYAAAMLTNPAHASLMTSLYPRDHGVYDNDSGIADGVPTLASQFKSHGYATAAIINFPHLNPDVANLGQGFTTLQKGSLRERNAPTMTAAALALIDTLPQPWFVWLHYTDPHAPYDPPTDIAVTPDVLPFTATPIRRAERAAPGFQRQNPWFKKAFRTYADTRAVAARYLGEVENVDRALSALHQGLTDRGLGAHTIWSVTADHGENLGEHDLYFHHGGLYRSTVHVPLLIHIPAEAPRILPGLVQSIDVAPTLLDLARVPLWEPMRGHSLASYARGAGAPDAYAFSEHMLGQMAAVRGPEGTLIMHRRRSRQFPTYPIVPGTQEFFAANDVLEEHPTEAPATLVAALQAFLKAPTAAYKPRAAPPSNREALRALGYIE